jgi:hypothetical protein
VGACFVATVGEGHDDVTTIELTVTVPIAVLPFGGRSRFVLAGDEHRDQVSAVELTVQVRVAELGSLQLCDPHRPVGVVDPLVEVQMVSYGCGKPIRQ